MSNLILPNVILNLGENSRQQNKYYALDRQKLILSLDWDSPNIEVPIFGQVFEPIWDSQSMSGPSFKHLSTPSYHTKTKIHTLWNTQQI
jgi:hypothetical protein